MRIHEGGLAFVKENCEILWWNNFHFCHIVFIVHSWLGIEGFLSFVWCRCCRAESCFRHPYFPTLLLTITWSWERGALMGRQRMYVLKWSGHRLWKRREGGQEGGRKGRREQGKEEKRPNKVKPLSVIIQPMSLEMWIQIHIYKTNYTFFYSTWSQREALSIHNPSEKWS